MATKDEMKLQINSIWLNHEHLLKLANVDRDQFFTWLEKTDGWDEVRKASTWAHKKFLGKIMKCREDIYCRMSYESWRVLMQTAKGMREVQILKEYLFDIKQCWMQRPKPARKGAE